MKLKAKERVVCVMQPHKGRILLKCRGNFAGSKAEMHGRETIHVPSSTTVIRQSHGLYDEKRSLRVMDMRWVSFTRDKMYLKIKSGSFRIRIEDNVEGSLENPRQTTLPTFFN